MAVSATENAALRVQTFLAKRGKGLGLRLGVKTTGCSGLAYKIEFVDQAGVDGNFATRHAPGIHIIGSNEVDFPLPLRGFRPKHGRLRDDAFGNAAHPGQLAGIGIHPSLALFGLNDLPVLLTRLAVNLFAGNGHALDALHAHRSASRGLYTLARQQTQATGRYQRQPGQSGPVPAGSTCLVRWRTNGHEGVG